MIKVRADQVGFYGGVLRTPGTLSALFEVKDKKEMGKWMTEVDDKGNPIEPKKTETAAEKKARETAEKVAKLKEDLATARSKGDEKGIAHAAGELAKLDPEGAKAEQLDALKAQLATAETAKDDKEIARLKAEISKLDPDADLT